MTVEEVARQALQSISSSAGTVVASGFFQTRYQNLAESGRFRHLRRFGEIVLPANLTDGAVDIIQDSPVVTGDADAQAAWAQLGSKLKGRFIRLTQQGQWYEIADLTGANLLLTLPVIEATSTDLGYTIVQRFHPLMEDCQWTGPFVHPKRRLHLREVNSAEFERVEPGRNLTTGGPYVVVLNCPPDPQTKKKRVEFYPYPGTTPQLVRYIYWASPPKLEQTDDLPSGLSPDVMKEGVAMDLCGWEFGEAMKAGRTEAAGFWRNEYNARMTRWEAKSVDKALDVDETKGLDSLEVLIRGNYVQRDDFGIGQSIRNLFIR